jgi:hypothetical protein
VQQASSCGRRTVHIACVLLYNWSYLLLLLLLLPLLLQG